MAQHAIVTKPNRLLVDPIDSECKAVYLLCETRKLLERVPSHQRPFALNMCCHWALHVDLRGTDTVSQFLAQVDAFIDGKLVGPEDFKADHQMVQEFLMLDTLRLQLRDFWQSLGIRTDLTDSDGRWVQFLKHYAGVIEDGSLAIRSQNPGLKHVKQVTFTKGPVLGEFVQLPFDMVWPVDLLNGRSLAVTVNARPPRDGLGLMVSMGVHLNA